MNAEHFPFNYTRRNGWEGVEMQGSRGSRVRGQGEALCFRSNCTAWRLPAWAALRVHCWGKRWKLWAFMKPTPEPHSFQSICILTQHWDRASLPSNGLQFSWENKSEMHKPGITTAMCLKPCGPAPPLGGGPGLSEPCCAVTRDGHQIFPILPHGANT